MLYTLANTTQEFADKTLWMPPQASTFAPEVDWLFYFILYINIFFFVLIAVLVFLFAYKYRRSANPAPRGTAIHSTGLEIFWSIIPFFVVMYIFYLGFVGYKDMVVAPPNGAYTIIVEAKKWSWSFVYTTPTGSYTDTDLHIPFDRPVKLILKSEDVLHALFIPAFRAKKDVVPGRYNTMWVQAKKMPEDHFDEKGNPTFPIYCAEYCGTNHSRMFSKVYIHKEGEFEDWLKKASDIYVSVDASGKRVAVPWAAVGKKLMASCFQCHSLVKDEVLIGPSFNGLWAKKKETLSDGTQVDINAEYVHESIEEPANKIVKGFEGKTMTPFKGKFSKNDFIAIIEFLKSQSPDYVPLETLKVEDLTAPVPGQAPASAPAPAK